MALRLSQKERNRMTVLVQVKEQKLSLVAAAEVMGLSYRQACAAWLRSLSKPFKAPACPDRIPAANWSRNVR
jgi:hypothetical protein